MDRTNLINPQLLAIARDQLVKLSFVDSATASAGDPAAAAAAGGGGGDPAAMAGGDPAMAAAGGAGGAGGAPPAGEDPLLAEIANMKAMIQQMQTAGAAGGAGAPGVVEPIKPKIDVNVEIMQIKNMIAKMVDALGIPVPAQEMSATPEKLTEMAQAQDSAGAGGAGAGQSSAIPSIQPIQGASPAMAQQAKAAETRLRDMSDRASAVRKVLQYAR